MALNRYIITANVTVSAAALATVVAGEPGTGGPAGYGSDETVASGEDYFAVTFLANTPILLDPAGAVYAAIGSGNLRAWVDGQDTVGHAGLSN